MYDIIKQAIAVIYFLLFAAVWINDDHAKPLRRNQATNNNTSWTPVSDVTKPQHQQDKKPSYGVPYSGPLSKRDPDTDTKWYIDH